MAFNDGSLQDAGRNYYEGQFGDRVRNVRKAGAAPATSSGRGCLGAGAGGGVALLVLIRIIVALAVGVGSHSYDSDYNGYTPTPITIDPPQQVEFNNDPPLWQPNRDDPALHFNPDVRPGDLPFVIPDNPPVVAPDDPPAPDPNAPPAVPQDGDKDK